MTVTGGARARWIRRGETVHVNGFGLFTGLFYVGVTFPGADARYNKFLVNPSLPIGRSAREYVSGGNGWSASYEELTPAGRRAYLEWVAGSCRDRDIPPEFARIYCGGLYYHVFVDGGGDVPTVLAEARRLIALHHGNRIFVDLLGNLLSFASGIGYRRGQVPTYRDEWKHSVHAAAEVRLRIASLIAAGEAIGADDAFLYAREIGKIGIAPDDSVVDPEGLRLLWRKLFAARFPDGIAVQPPATKLKLSLAAPDALGSMRVPVPEWCRGLPDPGEAQAFNGILTGLLAECVDALRRYTKLVRTKPTARGTLEAVGALPKQLVATSLAGRFASVKEVLDNALSKQGIVQSKVSRLFGFMEMPFADDSEITPAVRKLVSTSLGKMDIAFEPDSTYGAQGFSMSGNIVFFRAENGAPVDWRGAYALHRACADFVLGHVCTTASEAAAVERTLFGLRRADVGLGDPERTRLAAHARALAVDLGLRKGAPFRQGRLEGDADLARLASMVAECVASLPSPGREAIKTAERFLAKLGADPRLLHNAIHRRPADDGEPVPVVPGEPARGVAIPARPAEAPTPSCRPPALDAARLRALEEETDSVFSLLSDIFSEDAGTDPADRPVSGEAAGNAMPGLDAAHSSLLSAVMAAGSMARADFDALSRRLGLLPDGAVETVNDAAFDLFGEAVLVDNGDVIFEEHLRTELERAGSTS